MNITIRITIPKKGEKWLVSVGGGHFKRPNSIQVYNYVERRLLASSGSIKINLIVDYGVEHPLEPNDWKNEGLYTERKAALYALASFLEDYIPETTLQKKYRKYESKIL